MRELYDLLVGKQKNERLSDTASYKIDSINNTKADLYIIEKIKETRKKEIVEMFRFTFEEKEKSELLLTFNIDRMFVEKGLYEVDNTSNTYGVSYKIKIDSGFNIKEVSHKRTKNFTPEYDNEKNRKKYHDIEMSDEQMAFVINHITTLTEEKKALFGLLFDSKVEGNNVLNTLIYNINTISKRLKKELQPIKPDF